MIHARRRSRRILASLTTLALAAAGTLMVVQPAAADAVEPPPIVRTVSDAGFAHPGVGFTADHLENMREQVRAGVEPWASYYEAMTQTRYAARDFRAENAQAGTDLPVNDAYASVGMRSSALRDSIGALTQTLQYVVTGDEQYRANALHVVRTWSSLDPGKYAYFSDAHIHTGVPLYYLLIAADVLRSTTPENAVLAGYDLAWTDADQQRIEENLIHPVLETFLSSPNRLWNQHLYGVIGMVSAAIFLDDADLYAERVEWFTVNAGYESEHDLFGGDVNGALAAIFREIPADDPRNTTGRPFVQHMEMLRDQAHGQGDVDILVALARIVSNQGTLIDPVAGTVSTAADAVSPYRFLDNRILAGAETFSAFMMGEEIPYVPATEGGAISQAYRGRLQDPMTETYLQYRYVAGVDVDEEAPHVAELYEHRDGPLYYYGNGVQNFWSERGSDYTAAEYWVAFPAELAEVEDAAAPLAPGPELSVETFGTVLGEGAERRAAQDGSEFIRLDAAADDARLAVRRAVWADRTKTSLVGIKVRSDGSARLEAARSSIEEPFAEIVVPDTEGQWRYVWLDLHLEKTPGAVGDNILFLRATGSDALVDVSGVLAQANSVLTPPTFADAPALDVVIVADEPWSRPVAVTDDVSPTVALQDAPEGAVLVEGALEWTPSPTGEFDMLVSASDGVAVSALPVAVTVAASRETAIDAIVDGLAEEETYTASSWRAVVSARAEAEAAQATADAGEYSRLLEQLGDAVSGLQLLNPTLDDGSLDFTALASAAPLTAAQVRALTDGDNQTHWGDQRVSGVVFDFGAGFRLRADAFGIQARDSFPNRAEGTNVYGSDDGATWTLLTEHPNVGRDADVEWLDVREDARSERFRFVKFQVDEPGVPSDPAFPGIWSIAEVRIDGERSEARGVMDSVSVSSPDAVAGRVTPGDRVEVRLTGPEENSAVTVSVLGEPATVTSPAPGQWLAASTVPDDRATSDGSKLFVSTDASLVDDALRAATVLRLDGTTDAAWTQHAGRMLDGDATTHSDTRLNSGLYGHIWDLGEASTLSLTGAEILVRQDGYGTSRIADMRLEGSADGRTWTRLTPAAPAKTLDWQTWPVTDAAAHRYVRLVNGQILGVAELRLFGAVVPVEASPPLPSWDAATTYDAGDRVTHDGQIYLAQWWTQGQQPDSSATGSWMREGVAVVDAGDGVRSWTQSWVYTGGEVVAHAGRTWEAKWWTRNQEPGPDSGPWRDLGEY